MELPQLNPIEIRILGCLIEKSKTTPAYYPMTLNALVAACNQKTSRLPVVEYDDETVSTALTDLKAQSLVATAIGGGSRVVKWKHNFNTLFEIEPEELTVLCLLMLRGPQTVGEINTNSARLTDFHSLDQVLSVLHKLQHTTPPFVKELPKKPGQKEVRYAHLLGGDVFEDGMEDSHSHEPAFRNVGQIEERLDALETEVAELRGIVVKLLQDLERK